MPSSEAENPAEKCGVKVIFTRRISPRNEIVELRRRKKEAGGCGSVVVINT